MKGTSVFRETVCTTDQCIQDLIDVLLYIHGKQLRSCQEG